MKEYCMLTLYSAPGSCALASHIALAETGADYCVVAIDFAKGEQGGAEFLAINPKGRVPALVTDRGILSETPAILAFIAQSFPQADLAPLADPFAFGEMQAFNAYLCATAHVAHAHGRRGARWADEQSSFDDMKRKVPETMTASARLIEHSMLRGPWVMGEQYTVADPYLYTITGWLKGDGVDVSAFPGLMAHRARMEARPAVRQTLAEA
jgi:glutathione S-transferase